ncbi:MAG: hypothetical protein J0I06_01370 [Planctomycetes bacterium]|nr:hypothetical protein [Planctomycetota bacterium]
MRSMILAAVAVALAGPSSAPGDDKKAPPVSAEMKDFLKYLDGTEKGVNAGLKKYAAGKADVSAMEGIMVREPRVTKVETKGGESAYTVEVKTGILERTYLIRWKDQKIQKVEQLAIK